MKAAELFFEKYGAPELKGLNKAHIAYIKYFLEAYGFSKFRVDVIIDEEKIVIHLFDGNDKEFYIKELKNGLTASDIKTQFKVPFDVEFARRESNECTSDSTEK